MASKFQTPRPKGDIGIDGTLEELGFGELEEHADTPSR